jgi:hypothetical protein
MQSAYGIHSASINAMDQQEQQSEHSGGKRQRQGVDQFRRRQPDDAQQSDLANGAQAAYQHEAGPIAAMTGEYSRRGSR